MIVILYILGVFLLIVAAILILPWRFGLQAQNQPALDITAELKWALGMLGFRASYDREGFNSQIILFGFGKALGSDNKKSGTDSKSEKPKRKRQRGALSDYLNRSLIVSFTRFLRRLIKALRLDINLSGRYGFEEPDVTAMAALLTRFLGCGNTINLQPDYSQTVLDINGYIRGRVIIAQILGIGMQFLFSKPVRAKWLPKIKFKRKGKEIIQYA
ncbi:MAG: hypothetical protein ABFD04_04070 [Syntrophomonas sp.]